MGYLNIWLQVNLLKVSTFLVHFAIFAPFEYYWIMKIKYSARFTLRAYGKYADRYQICLRVTFNHKQTILSSGHHVEYKDAWDTEAMRVVNGYVSSTGTKAREINDDLQQMVDNLDFAFKFFEVNGVYPTSDELIMKYKEKTGEVVPPKPIEKEIIEKKKEAEPNFFKTFIEFTAECGEKNAWTQATYEKFAALERDLRAYKSKISFKDINETWLTGFVGYLRDSKKLATPRSKQVKPTKENPTPEPRKREDEYGVKNSTLEKKLSYLKWFLKWATLKGYNKNIAYQTFKPTLKTTQKKVIYLTKDEIRKVINLQLPKNKSYLERVRDVFIFCCFTGLRHSDVLNLRRSDIKEGHIEVTTVKTADSLVIEMNKMSMAILEKYKDIPLENNKALPVISNQTMNVYLKELCELAGIDEEIRITTYHGNERKDEIRKKYQLIGTHTGRKTFIVNALSHGIAPNIVMKWTGHSDYKAMKPYIDIVDSIKAQEMSKMDFMD